MRSIRLSLILYFLLLLGAALGGVSYFCYQSTQEALAAKESSTRKLWEKQFEENKRRLEADFEARKHRVEDEFDAKVLAQARGLGEKAAWYHNRIESLYVLGLLGCDFQNGAFLNLFVPLTETAYLVKTNRFGQLRYDIRIQGPHTEDDGYPAVVEDTQFFQTYLNPPRFGPFKGEGPPPKGDSFPRSDPIALEASDTLGGLVWQLDKEQKRKADEGQPLFDEVRLKSRKVLVRRVTIKVPVTWSRRGVVVEPKEGVWFPKLPKAGEDQPNSGFKPWLYLQYGVDISARDKSVANLRAKLAGELIQLQFNLDEDLSHLRTDLDEARLQLRTRFLWVGLGAFAAVLVGGFVLVRVSLSPLKRLSDAVSRVSEKDFRLPIDQAKLPRELKPIASRLAHTLEQLKHAFDREKQAAADLSHELRTPVAALLTTLEITLRKPRSADEYREVLSDCRESGQQISNLVERLLALARLDAGAEQLRPCEVDVAALADQCAALVRPLAEARGLHVDVHHNGPAFLNADPNKLREVLTNLLHNAIEYNRPNGAVAVRVERHNGQLDMEVRDTGIGMAPEVRQHIFERFFRADPSRQADGPHAGLGLAIVKGYVDLMGGSIEVNSTVGQGSTFRVRLPVIAK